MPACLYGAVSVICKLTVFAGIFHVILNLQNRTYQRTWRAHNFHHIAWRFHILFFVVAIMHSLPTYHSYPDNEPYDNPIFH